jgi:1-acyl-sn-glycerol-3-phosphate acyltransferase
MLDYRKLSSSRELTLPDRAEWLHRWCGRLLDRLHVTREVSGPTPRPGLVVSNHLSYLDILVIGAHMPCVFVSKSEVKNWPVFGTLTTNSGTVYIDRTRRGDTRNANDGIRSALKQGMRVVIFPEGTSSDGSKVLPFYPSLLEPAVEAGAPITAAYLEYEVEQGSAGRDVAYWGEMTFFPHLLRLLSVEKISARLKFAEAPRTFADRKSAATEMREEVLRLRQPADI